MFIHLEAVAASLPPLPAAALILDVGGGDGAVLDVVLARFPDARAVMVDLATGLGGQLRAECATRTTILEGTSAAQYAERGREHPDVILVSDVIHHVPPETRLDFLRELAVVARGGDCMLFVKDIEPGYVRARASLLADRWISGDRRVRLIGSAELAALAREIFPDVEPEATELIRLDPPHYGLLWRLPGA
jgi:2-polyprenyl-3-methyl-5-hydroxy-6-metoxy-1,4-benzoquinol methylase